MAGRPKRKGTVYQRAGSRVWQCQYWHLGEQQQESTGETDKRLAERYLSARIAEIDAGTWQPKPKAGRAVPAPAPAALTVAEYAETWIASRTAAGVHTADKEAARLRAFLIPEFGERALADVKRPEIKALVAKVRTTPIKTAKKGEAPRLLSPRSVLHVYAAIRAMFAEAVADEIIPATPCTLKTKKGELPEKRDRDPRWRSAAVYTAQEAAALISDPRVPIDRQVYYALGFLTGMRKGEIHARRWRDYDAAVRPLGRLTVPTQIVVDGARYVERETKTGAVPEVPVVPLLAEILDTWRREGFEAVYGRAPRADDWIVPLRSDVRRHRTDDALGQLKGDLARLGLRAEGRALHAMRATFRSELENAGAIMSIVDRVTHAPPTNVGGGYHRPGWPALCNEVAKLPIVRPTYDGPYDSRPAAGSDTPVFAKETMTPRGLEPLLPA